MCTELKDNLTYNPGIKLCKILQSIGTIVVVLAASNL